MIKADTIATRIEGTNLDIAIQFFNIMDGMLEQHPEKVAAYIRVRNEKIKEAIKSADIDEIKMSEIVYNAVLDAEKEIDNGEA